MQLKSGLRYNEDYVVVSAPIWKFLKNQYGGGPDIEVVAEQKKDNFDYGSSNVHITNDTEI
eukprot:CAMPEP_0114590866 /NCGR_PEP_ID=MMETSP0125-20121206/13032_1 /TAXON_ID=485358 ORGANISM="Aristerostoma sp., Strain ATCC 50986" /NCGR_SAMPLE_ID=MMETSP0125 /ASSEMBLY_ACC=CAM_ASM_000245 /LENGTH=60 /DNA_ID=CAMNT_0001788617 /DNA_START=323 /DNA_END=505 /DNA_ORIENTATION=+